jgi:hypothetical protein
MQLTERISPFCQTINRQPPKQKAKRACQSAVKEEAAWSGRGTRAAVCTLGLLRANESKTKESGQLRIPHAPHNHPRATGQIP